MSGGFSSKYWLAAGALLALRCGALAEAGSTNAGFETAGLLQTQAFLGKVALAGAGYQVNGETFNDGLLNTYYLVTDFGESELLGSELLIERINEVAAITDLKKASAGATFGGAVGKAGSDKIVSAGKAILNPIKTIGNIPKGASRFFGGIGEAMKFGTSAYEDSAYASVAGASKAKRELAAKYRVNPYSSNPVLQDELNKVAWVQAGVGLGVDAGLSVATAGAAGIALTAVNVNQTLYQTMIDEDPSNLRIMNRKKLLEIGIPREVTEELLQHPWFSPWHNTVICESLKSLGSGKNQAAFIKLAAQATTEVDAIYFQRTAQMIAKYHRTVAQVDRIEPQGLAASFFDKAGCLVVPLYLDYMRWTERVGGRLESLKAAAAKHGGGGITVWTTGDCSPRAQQELAARNVKLVTRVATED